MTEEEKLKKLQNTQLGILKEFDRVCNILDLQYCLAFGSSLGAVRHKGFIPWDDDIDVYMRIEDLETLQKNESLFNKPFFLQYKGSDPEYGLMISRLRNSNTTLIEATEINRDINHGVFIDIYPLFNSPKEGWGAKKLVIASMIYRLMLYGVAPQNRGSLMRIGSSILLKTIPHIARNRIIDNNYRKMKSYPYTGYLSRLHGDEANLRYPYSWFFPVKRVPFEDIEAPIEAEPDKYLKLIFGDYMKLPPEEERHVHHDYACLDTEESYTCYRGKVYCKDK